MEDPNLRPADQCPVTAGVTIDLDGNKIPERKHLAPGGATVTAFPLNALAITPNDDVDLDPPCQSVWVGGDGDVTVITFGGQTETYAGMKARDFVPVMVRRVLADGTTATSLKGHW